MKENKDFEGRWKNDRGSELLIRQNGETITGFYSSHIGDNRIQDQRHKLVGRATGKVLGFVVAWTAASSVTSWSGRLIESRYPGGRPALHTIWHLVRYLVSEEPFRVAEPWESFLTFTSVFEKLDDDFEEPVD